MPNKIILSFVLFATFLSVVADAVANAGPW
jgi:hypothetical protein